MKKRLLVMLLACFSLLAEAKVIYVSSTATGTANGTSWANAYTDLQVAIYNSVNGDEVWVKKGTYYPTISQNNSTVGETYRTFWLRDNVSVLGGFFGTETLKSERDPVNHKATLDGKLSSGTKVMHVVTASTNSNSVLDGFIVQNGAAPNYSAGGGVYLSGHTTFKNMVFINNTAVLQGGAVFASQSSSQFINCRFESNKVTFNDGGAVYLENSDLKFTNCVFFNNQAARYGGVATMVNSNATFQNCTFAKNTGVHNLFQLSNTTGGSWKTKITESIIWDNTGTLHGNQVGTVFDITKNLTTNPFFTDLGTGDLTLRSVSDAIDNPIGSITSPYPTDIAGNNRLHNTHVDLGAYEFGGTSTRIPNRFYVAHDATGANDGTSWADAFTDLQEAIYFSSWGDTIWVKEGTYYPTINSINILPTAVDRHFWLRDDVSVLGGFVGTETLVSERDPVNHKATLDGQVDFSNKVTHVIMASSNSGSIVDGFIVQNGASTGSGGGVYLTGHTTFKNMVFINNTAVEHGGGVFAHESSSKFINCRFESNQTNTYDGGAVYIQNNSDLEFTNCVFFNNYAKRFGAVATAVNSTVTFQNCTFAKNKGTINIFQLSKGSGASSEMKITESIIFANTGTHYGFQSGTVFEITNNLTTDPLFTNLAAGDLTLTSNSDAIDNPIASATNPYATDIAGNNRLVDTYVDLGAYEYQGAITGMLSNLDASELKLYPNPVSGTKLSISEPGQWRVFTLQGRTLNQGNGTEIDVSNLVEGSYLIEVTMDGQRTTKTFIKK